MGRGGYNGGGGGGGWTLWPKGYGEDDAIEETEQDESPDVSQPEVKEQTESRHGDLVIQVHDSHTDVSADVQSSIPPNKDHLSSTWKVRNKSPSKDEGRKLEQSRLEDGLPVPPEQATNTYLGTNEAIENAFLADLDKDAQAYMSLILQYSRRRNQGRDTQYKLFASAMAGQDIEEERACRTSMVEFFDDRAAHTEFDGSKALQEYLSSVRNKPAAPRRRLFILEDLSNKIVCQLGSFLRIHPSIFASHFSLEDGPVHSNSIATFPSINQLNTVDGLDYASSIGGDPNTVNAEKRHFAVGYPVVMPRLSASHNPDPRLCPSWLKPNKRLADQSAYANFNVERSLHTPTLNDIWDVGGRVATMAGQATYWSRTSQDGGWDALLLVDPCIKDPQFLAMLAGAPSPNLHRILQYPDLDDKLDLSEDTADWKPSATFTKFILYDDLIKHLALGGSEPGATPIAITPFIRGFAINQWVVFLNHVTSSAGSIRSKLIADGFRETPNGWQYSANWGALWSEWVFERVQAWKIDLILLLNVLESNMHALGLDPDDITSFGMVGKREAQMWRYIRNMLTRHRELFQDIANSYTQVIALRETQTSNLQARSVGRLAVLGTLFVPASLMASMLSMGGDFLPGRGRFWIYCAVTVPLVVMFAVCLFTGLVPWIYSVEAKTRNLRREHFGEARSHR